MSQSDRTGRTRPTHLSPTPRPTLPRPPQDPSGGHPRRPPGNQTPCRTRQRGRSRISSLGLLKRTGPSFVVRGGSPTEGPTPPGTPPPRHPHDPSPTSVSRWTRGGVRGGGHEGRQQDHCTDGTPSSEVGVVPDGRDGVRIIVRGLSSLVRP